MTQDKKDIELLKALYYGNHVEYKDLERVKKVIKMMENETKRRIF